VPYIFQTGLPGDLKLEQNQAAQVTGVAPRSFAFSTSQMKPNKVTPGGEVKIVDSKNFPVTPIATAIVKLKPGGLRELHWHPNADEWQYYISGKGRMGVFAAGTRARTMDFQAGDVGYVLQSQPHYIENTGDTDLVFLEMFDSGRCDSQRRDGDHPVMRLSPCRLGVTRRTRPPRRFPIRS